MKGPKCFTSKCPLSRRSYAPGVHGPKAMGRNRQTPYGAQLREKQKAKRSYGLMETQFRNYVEAAGEMKGNTAENLLEKLETRLDNVLYRLGVSESRAAARQLVNHGHITVNGRKLDIPSYAVRPKDTIAFDEFSEKIVSKKLDALTKAERPAWLNFDLKKKQATILSKPTMKDVEHTFDLAPIIEYYSR